MSFMFNLKFRYILPLILITFAIINVGYVLLIEIPSILSIYENHSRRDLIQSMNRVQGTLNRLFRGGNLVGMRQEVSFIGSREGVYLVLVLDVDNKVLASNRNEYINNFTRETLDESEWALMKRARDEMRGMTIVDDETYRITGAFPLSIDIKGNKIGSERTGMFVVRYDYVHGYRMVEMEIYRSLLIMISGLALLTALLWYFFHRAFTLPIQDLIAASASFARGDYGTRINERGPGEIVILGNAFNSMASEIQRAHATMQIVNHAVESTRDSMYWINENGQIFHVNLSACTKLGYERGELLGKDVSFIDPDFPSSAVSEVWKKIRAVKSMAFESRHRKSDGTYFPVEIRVDYIQGKEREYLFVLASDISDKKLAKASMRENEKYLRSLLDSQPNIVIINDGESLVDANREFFRFFNEYESVQDFRREHRCICEFFEPVDRPGYLREEVNGKSWCEVIQERPDIFHKALIRRNGKDFIFAVRLEVAMLKGGIRNIATFSDITVLEDTQISLELQVNEEVTKRRIQEQKLIQQAKIVQMGEMLTNLAHHWRQPLNIIGLNVQDLMDAYEFGELDKSYLEDNINKVLFELKKMSHTIDQYRELITTRNVKKIFDLYDPVEMSIELAAPGLESHFVNIVKDLRRGLLCLGDPSQLSQSILNILNNAREALVDRGAKNRIIEVRLFQGEDGCPEITVTDTAGGIDDQIMERIFEPFFTTRDLTTRTGTGLYFSKLMIEEELKGTIQVVNTQKGARFSIRLPCVQEFEEDASL